MTWLSQAYNSIDEPRGTEGVLIRLVQSSNPPICALCISRNHCSLISDTPQFLWNIPLTALLHRAHTSADLTVRCSTSTHSIISLYDIGQRNFHWRCVCSITCVNVCHHRHIQLFHLFNVLSVLTCWYRVCCLDQC